ncbi:hypothetical protein [Microbacterium halophytorum]|uniref:hypothetical protein n=1 Tax=Microbacterium halophytorum TaxID=2067568 RepID=UPI000CFA92BE|nr:hypothetical protein [Microbacterium halophytorum]
MFVITADQDASRRTGERVEPLLAALEALIETEGLPGVLRPFERTVGDEVQAVLTDADTTVRLALELQRLREWAVGIGVGEVEHLADDSRSSSGAVFIAAREAVERAGSRSAPAPVAVVAGGAAERAADQGAGRAAHRAEPAAVLVRDAEALLQLMAAVVRRRTEAGWEMIDARLQAPTARAAAEALGISPQAASQRLQAALWDEVRGVEPLAAGLLRRLDAATAG